VHGCFLHAHGWLQISSPKTNLLYNEITQVKSCLKMLLQWQGLRSSSSSKDVNAAIMQVSLLPSRSVVRGLVMMLVHAIMQGCCYIHAVAIIVLQIHSPAAAFVLLHSCCCRFHSHAVTLLVVVKLVALML